MSHEHANNRRTFIAGLATLGAAELLPQFGS